VLDAAPDAFVQALQVSALTSAVIVLAVALLVALLLRNVRPRESST
jgi:hypothetical protein